MLQNLLNLHQFRLTKCSFFIELRLIYKGPSYIRGLILELDQDFLIGMIWDKSYD